jgi:hypothetical protein
MEGEGIVPIFVYGAHKFSKILEATSKLYKPEKGETKQVPY